MVHASQNVSSRGSECSAMQIFELMSGDVVAQQYEGRIIGNVIPLHACTIIAFVTSFV